MFSKNPIALRPRLLGPAVRRGLIIGLAGSAQLAQAATITVKDAGDAGTASTCTLRQAIASANANSAGSSTCTAGSGADTIVFAAGITSVTLGASGALNLTSSVLTTIDGGAGGVTIDGNNATGVFSVGLGAAAAFKNLTIQHGMGTHQSGAGIYTKGAITVTDCTIADNTSNFGEGAGIGVYKLGSATLTNVTLTGNHSTYGGAALRSNGTLIVSGSALTGNSSENLGAAIYTAYGQLTITDSTISGNTSAIMTLGYGATIKTRDTNVTLTRVTVSGNSGHVPAISFESSGTVALTNATVSGNSSSGAGGTILTHTNTPVQITNSTIAGNSAASVAAAIANYPGSTAPHLLNTIVASSTGVPNCSGTIVDDGGNLDDGNSCGFGGSSLSNADAGLGPLTDNGGPTLTRMPSATNAGVDAIDCVGAPATDQRGVARPIGPKCDIGAVESGLKFSVSDNSAFGFYGKTVLYVVTLENKSTTDAASNVHVTGAGTAALNEPGTMWFCTIGTCTTTPTFGAFSDTATLPPSGTLTWLVSVPVFPDSNESTATFAVSAPAASGASDTDTLAIFRSTFE